MGMFDHIPKAGEPAASPQDTHKEPAADEGFVAPFLSGAYDVARSAAGGVRKGVEQAIGLPGSVGAGMSSLNNMLRESMGFDAAPSYAETAEAGGFPNLSPTMEDVNVASEERLGAHYRPQTTAGEYAGTIGEFAPGMFIGGNAGAAPVLAGRAMQAARPTLSQIGRMLLGETVAPAVASETAGQLTEGTEFEPYARTAGALAGGMGGALATRPRQAMTAPQREREALLGAANRRGVELPEYMMPDSPGAETMAQRMADLPFLGQPVRDAGNRVANQMGDRVRETAEAAAPSGSADYTTAVNRLDDTLTDYNETFVRDRSRANYQAVDAAITRPDARRVPTHTMQAIRDLQNVPTDAKRALNQRAVSMIWDDVYRGHNRANNPGNTYAELKELRTIIGGAMDNHLLPDFASVQPALKRLYGAITDDMEPIIRRSGGQPAVDAWHHANTEHSRMRGLGDEISKVIGKEGEVPADDVMKRTRRLGQASDRSAGNRLNIMQLAMDESAPGSWDDVTSGIMNRLGHDAQNPGQFSPGNFAKEYARLSEEGRHIYWPDPDVRSAVDDFAALSRNFTDAREPSKWAMPQSIGTAGALGFSGVMNPLIPLGAVATGYTVSRLLSRRASAQKLLSWARARQAGGAVAPNVVRELADEIAKETGEDANAIAAQLGEGEETEVTIPRPKSWDDDPGDHEFR